MPIDKIPQEVKESLIRMSKHSGFHVIVIFIALLSLFLFQYACTPINRYVGLPDDHPIEQMAESLIKNKTGLDIDLTPGN